MTLRRAIVASTIYSDFLQNILKLNHVDDTAIFTFDVTVILNSFETVLDILIFKMMIDTSHMRIVQSPQKLERKVESGKMSPEFLREHCR